MAQNTSPILIFQSGFMTIREHVTKGIKAKKFYQKQNSTTTTQEVQTNVMTATPVDNKTTTGANEDNAAGHFDLFNFNDISDQFQVAKSNFIDALGFGFNKDVPVQEDSEDSQEAADDYDYVNVTQLV